MTSQGKWPITMSYLKRFLDFLEDLKWLDAFYDCQKVQKKNLWFSDVREICH